MSGRSSITDYATVGIGSRALHPMQPKRETERILPYQWSNSSGNTMMESAIRGTDATAHRATSQSISDITNTAQKDAYSQANSALIDKVNAANKVKELAETVLNDVNAEISLLEDCMALTEATIAAKKPPIASTEECMSVRAARPGQESIRDPVERNLEEQLSVLSLSVQLLESAYAAQRQELARLMGFKGALEEDIMHKNTAIEIDMSCLDLKPGKPVTPKVPELQTQYRSVGGALQAIDPCQWQGSTENICHNANKAIQTSTRLRKKTDELINTCADNEAKKHATLLKNTKISLQSIDTHIQALEEKLNNTMVQLVKEETTIDELQQSLKDKEEPLQIAQNRLAIRSERPGQEMVYDGAQKALEAEVAQIKDCIAQLTREYKQHVLDWQTLNDSKNKLEADINLKKAFHGLESNVLAVQEGWLAYEK